MSTLSFRWAFSLSVSQTVPCAYFANSPLPQDAARNSKCDDRPPQLVDNLTLNVPRPLDSLNYCQWLQWSPRLPPARARALCHHILRQPLAFEVSFDSGDDSWVCNKLLIFPDPLCNSLQFLLALFFSRQPIRFCRRLGLSRFIFTALSLSSASESASGAMIG